MASKVTLTLHEGNDETVALTITPAGADDDLLDVDSLELILKDDQCADDADGLILTTADPAELLVLAQAVDEITAEAYIPGSALADPYDRWWRLDALSASGSRRTVMYGPVIVVNT